MKFLGLIAIFLVAGASAEVREPAGQRDFDAPEEVETTETKTYKLEWKEFMGKLQGAMGGMMGGHSFGPIEGTTNLLLTGITSNVRGVAKGLEPSLQAVYATPIPTLRIILAGAKIKVCGPQTHLEFLLNHVVCFVNGPLYKGLAVAPLPICIPSREVQCYGPFLRLPETLTPEQIAKGDYGLLDSDWGHVGDIQLKEVGPDGEETTVQHIEPVASPDSSADPDEIAVP